MKNAIKGALFSGLIFPGLGQIVLKRYRRGLVLMVTTFVSLMGIVIKTVEIALAILENPGMRGQEIDINAITEAATRVISTSDRVLYRLCLFMIIACWIFGIVDAYRIGKEKDQAPL